MIGLDRGGQLANRPTPNATVAPGFVNNDLTQATQPTIMDPDFLNGEVTEDAVLAYATGQTPSKTIVNQRYMAIPALAHLVDTGSADALAVSPPQPPGAYGVSAPVDTALPDGFTIEVVVAATNLTATPKIAWAGGAQRTITDELGAALNPGDLVAARTARLRKTGGASPSFLLLNSRTAGAGTVGATVKLKASLATAGTSVAFTADEVAVATSLAGTPYQLANYSETLNGATTGAGGMDTGALPTSGFVSIYAIYNPAAKTVSILGTTASQSSVYAGSNMPSGYTASSLIAIWPTNSSAQLAPGIVIGRKFYYLSSTSNGVLGGGSALSWTSISLSSFVPAAAVSALLVANLGETSSIGINSFAAFNASPSFSVALVSARAQVLNHQNSDTLFELPLLTAQTAYYQAGQASVQAVAQVQGYSI